ncbi:MAG: hypothetical protein V1824_03885, partial [archaeon]
MAKKNNNLLLMILLIVIVAIILLIVFSGSKKEIKPIDTIPTTEDNLTPENQTPVVEDYKPLVFSEVKDNVVFFSNPVDNSTIIISAYTYLNKEKDFVNNSLPIKFDKVIRIEPGETKGIELDCIPGNEFSLTLTVWSNNSNQIKFPVYEISIPFVDRKLLCTMSTKLILDLDFTKENSIKALEEKGIIKASGL